MHASFLKNKTNKTTQPPLIWCPVPGLLLKLFPHQYHKRAWIRAWVPTELRVRFSYWILEWSLSSCAVIREPGRQGSLGKLGQWLATTLDIAIYFFPKGSSNFHPYWQSKKTHFFASILALNIITFWFFGGGGQNCGGITLFLFIYYWKLKIS